MSYSLQEQTSGLSGHNLCFCNINTAKRIITGVFMFLRIFEAVAQDLLEEIPAPVFRGSVLRAVANAEENENPEAAKHIIGSASAARETRANALIKRIRTSREDYSDKMKQTLGDVRHIEKSRRPGEHFLDARKRLEQEGVTEFERGTLIGSHLATERAKKEGDSAGAASHAQRHVALMDIAHKLGRSAHVVAADELDPQKEKRVSDYAALRQNSAPEPAVAEPASTTKKEITPEELDTLELTRRAEKNAARKLKYLALEKQKMTDLKIRQEQEKSDKIKNMVSSTK
jgi:hypothetical protein